MEEDTLEEYAFVAYHEHFRIKERRTQQRNFHTHKIDQLASVHPWCSVVLAVEEILKDLKRGAERAREHGALGWQKNPAPPTNKTFLRNMLVSTLRDNRPLGFQRKLHNTGHADSSSKQQDRFPVPKKDSETYFRYNDKHPTKARLRSVDSDKGDTLLSSRHRTRDPEKRPRESSCDSKDERKNGDSKNNGRGAKKRHKRTAAGESSRETVVKKKNKKSKKSKKHKSKKSGRSAKHKS